MDPTLGRSGDDDPGGEIIWLFDADAAPDLQPCSPAELFRRLDLAAQRAGLAAVAVRGCIRGLRRRGRICTFELTDQEPSVPIARSRSFGSSSSRSSCARSSAPQPRPAGPSKTASERP